MICLMLKRIILTVMLKGLKQGDMLGSSFVNLDDGGLDQSDGRGGGEKWSDSNTFYRKSQ